MSQESSNNPKHESSLHSINITPGFVLLASSIPVCLGAYGGYKLEINQAATTTPETYSPGSTASGRGVLFKLINSRPEVLNETTLTIAKNVGATAAKINVSMPTSSTATVVQNVNPARVAFKALGIGSLFSVGGFGLLTASVFFFSGCNSLQELISSCRKWTPVKRKELEQKLGIKAQSIEHEDVKATAHMTEDEEWEYIKRKYIPELIENETNSKGK